MRRWLLGIAAVGAALLAVLAVLAERTALPAVMPVELVGMAAAGMAIVAGWFFAHASPRRNSRRLMRVAAVLLVAMAGWLGWQRFGGFSTKEVYFEGSGARLAGTLYLPSVASPAPAAVIVHGSGEATRTEYAYYARQLARRGIAALVYDKRGSGASGGDLYDRGYEAYAADARAGYDLLAARGGRVGFIGYSEGEWTVPLAAQGRDPSFIAIVGASGLSPEQQVWEEMALRLQRAGFTPDAIAAARSVHRAATRFERTGEGRKELQRILSRARAQPWFDAAEDLPEPGDLGAPEEYAWWRAVMDTDPADLWQGIDAPVLILKGSADDRSSAALTARRFSDIAPNAQVWIFPGADHLLLDRSHALPRFAEGYFDGLAHWIRHEGERPSR